MDRKMKASANELEHKYKVKMMKLRPKLIGLDGIALSCGESPLFDNDIIVREPDGLMFDPYTQTLYNIEYKLHNSSSGKNSFGRSPAYRRLSPSGRRDNPAPAP